MKITDVIATPLKTGTVVVRVLTEQGIAGVGECSPMNTAVIAHFVNTALKPIVVGENPLEIDKLWHKMMFNTYKLGVQGVQPEAIAGSGADQQFQFVRRRMERFMESRQRGERFVPAALLQQGFHEA